MRPEVEELLVGALEGNSLKATLDPFKRHKLIRDRAWGLAMKREYLGLWRLGRGQGPSFITELWIGKRNALSESFT